MTNKSLLLFSGGFDSVVLLRQLISQGIKPELLFIDYGQKNRKEELKHTDYWADKYSLNAEVLTLPSFNWSGSAIQSSSEGEVDKADDSIQYIEMRNLIFSSYAISIAQSKGLIDIYMAILEGNYADSTPGFIKSLDALAMNSVGIQILAPFLYCGKFDLSDLVIENTVRGWSLREILDHSISCNLVDDEGKPCGECSDCKCIEEIKNNL